MRTELIKSETTVKVAIPTLDGKAVAEIVEITVPCMQDPDSGEEYLGSEAMAKMDQVKARYMGLLLPEEIKQLRESMGVTQKKMSELLQIGAKSYTRWETGKERPSRSMNLFLRAIADGKVTFDYLRTIQRAGKVLREEPCEKNAVLMAGEEPAAYQTKAREE